ncbi:hypothetical protein ACAF76_011270 [Brevibacillus sp. TJ4]|uniref:hypothetical protein n=1 Tax=Brevibacillus sp. TJ4 TaxID=3234853 RepID=UPI0037D574AC
MGNVDFASMPWDFFWVGVGYFMITGVLFCFGFLRFAQQRKRSGYMFMAGAAVSATVFLTYLYKYHL